MEMERPTEKLMKEGSSKRVCSISGPEVNLSKVEYAFREECQSKLLGMLAFRDIYHSFMAVYDDARLRVNSMGSSSGEVLRAAAAVAAAAVPESETKVSSRLGVSQEARLQDAFIEAEEDPMDSVSAAETAWRKIDSVGASQELRLEDVFAEAEEDPMDLVGASQEMRLEDVFAEAEDYLMDSTSAAILKANVAAASAAILRVLRAEVEVSDLEMKVAWRKINFVGLSQVEMLLVLLLPLEAALARARSAYCRLSTKVDGEILTEDLMSDLEDLMNVVKEVIDEDLMSDLEDLMNVVKEVLDEEAYKARQFHDRWNFLFSGRFAHFEDHTRILPMRYTFMPPVDKINPCDTIQVFSAKIVRLGGGFDWPLDVYGLVAIRDTVDQNRNIIFLRSRFDCQTLTAKHSDLVLTGPSRAIVLSDRVTLEINLKVKGPTEPEDKTLCCFGDDILSLVPQHSCLFHQTCTSIFCTLEVMLGHIIFSVEATIFVRLIDGPWPDGFHGEFAACTSNIDHDCGDKVPILGATSVSHKRLILLSFGAGNFPVFDGSIMLSRCVVSVQMGHRLNVSARAWHDDYKLEESNIAFSPKEKGTSNGFLDIKSCKMEVHVYWSLVSDQPEVC